MRQPIFTFAAMASLTLSLTVSAHDGLHAVHTETWFAPQDAKPQEAEPSKKTSKSTSFVEIEVRGDTRYIRANGLPNHPTGRFPNRGNPNSIKPQTYTFSIPVTPTETAQRNSAGMGMFGVALNGCFFEAGTAEYYQRDRNSGWRIEAIGPRGAGLGLDANNAHVQRSGAYHYHSIPTGLMETLTEEKTMRTPLHIGWAADGYPIYGPWGYTDSEDEESPVKRLTSSWQLKKGERPNGPGGRYDGTYTQDFEYVEGSGDLDESNGRFGVTPEFPEGTYYYVVTDEFPFIGRSWKGKPSSGMRKPGGAHSRGAGRNRGQGQPDAGDRPGRGRGRGRGRRPNQPDRRSPIGG